MGYFAALGLSSAAGLNAYIPLLVLAVMAQFTSTVTLPPGWEWMSSGWMIVIVAVLLVAELVLDHYPVLDTFNDVVNSIIRPVAGGLLFAAAVGTRTSAFDPPSHPNAGWFILGAVIALGFHLLKMFTRPIANITTFGLATGTISNIQNVICLIGSFVALYVPVLVIIVIIVMVCFDLWLRRQRKKRKKTEPPAPSNGDVIDV
ncbi:MAG: DUF4126 domain-containing protein [Actinomycetaceae bacterium]|nr:DUF4126 domain-containing protein [Actinomycetaceae bacterium]MDU0969910.1 DUF4126 domain-containing protein [Actinomycetaceae bacterium]